MVHGVKYTKSAFFTLLSPIVKQVRQEGGPLFPSVRLAQNWFETGGVIPAWNNLAGYKVGSGKTTAYWDGSCVNTATKEVHNGVTVNTKANWRAYASLYHFYKDQDLLFNSSRYDQVRSAETPEAQCNALQTCGYATDPAYARKLLSIIKSNNLTQYDRLGVNDAMTKEEKEAFASLQKIVQAQNQRIMQLEANAKLAEIPVWAAKACAAAGKVGAVDTVKGSSLDFYRMLTVMYRRGLFDEE